MQIGGMYTIDFAKVSKIPKFNVNIKTGDIKRVIKLILLKNNVVLNLNNYTIVVAAKKSDGTDIFNDVKKINAINGVCEVEITEQMLVLNTDLPCEIILYGADGTVAASSNFTISKVHSARSEKDIVSSNEFKALSKAMTDIENKRSKDVKITNSDLDTSSNDVKIKPINLSDEVKEMMTGSSSVSPTIEKFSINRENLNVINTDILVEKKVLSNNLFNKNDIKIGYTIGENGNIYPNSSGNYFVTNYIPVEPNTKYATSIGNAYIYDSSGTFLTKIIPSNDYTFTTPSSAAYFRSYGGVEYLDNYGLCKGDSLTADKYNYTLDNLKLSEDEEINLSKKINKKTYIVMDTIKNIDFTKKGKGYIFYFNGVPTYGNTIYLYNHDNKYLGKIKLPDDYSVEIPIWSFLVYNASNHTLEVVKESTASLKDRVILLSVGYDNISSTGMLFNKLNNNFINANSNVVISGEPYFIQDTVTSFIKFDSINIVSDSKNILFHYQDIVNSVVELTPNKIQKSYEGVEKCIALNDGESLVYDFQDSKFKVVNTKYIGSYLYIASIQNLQLTGELQRYHLSWLYKNRNWRSDYIKYDYLNNIYEKEREVIESLDTNDFIFGLTADMHIAEIMGGYRDVAYNVMNRLNETLGLDAIVNLGDTVRWGKRNKTKSIAELTHVMKKMRKNNLIHCVGNHDYNGISDVEGGKQLKDWTITLKETYNILGRHLKDVVWGSKEDMYFYKDFKDKKIRLIVLNTADTGQEWIQDPGTDKKYLKVDPLIVEGCRQQQLEWLANKAFNFSDKEDKSEWHTLIATHIGVYSDSEGLTGNFGNLENQLAIRNIINSFRQGTNISVKYTDEKHDTFHTNITTSFKNQGPMNFIAVFSGHNHLDRIVNTDNGLINISTTCAYPSVYPFQTDGITRTPNEYSGFALDIVIINKETKTVILKRFGGGSDRTFTY